MERRAATDAMTSPMSVYEMHLASWRRVPEEGNRSLTYREMAEWLPDYLVDMGFTHVEMMPVAEHPFSGSWGYQVSCYYAPTSRFGSPDDFRFLVDALHARNIGVIVDWVPAHFPKDAFALARFDGTALYEHADPRQGEHPDWGTLVFNFGRHEVSNFLLANALFWMEEFHIDGLRVDAVASMLYLDYSRKEGEWLPNQFGGRENLEAVDFLRRMNELVYGNHPGAITMAEESTAWPAVSRPTYLGGLGFGFKWNMGWMHDTLEYFSKPSIYRTYHHHHLTFGLLYAFTENFVLPLSHDEVVHGKGSLLDKMPGEGAEKFAQLRCLYCLDVGPPGQAAAVPGVRAGPGPGVVARGQHRVGPAAVARARRRPPPGAAAEPRVWRGAGAVRARLRPVRVPVDRRQRRRPERDLLRPDVGRRVAEPGVRGQHVRVPTAPATASACPRAAGGAPPSTPSPPSSPAGARPTATTSAPTASAGTASTSPSRSTCPR